MRPGNDHLSYLIKFSAMDNKILIPTDFSVNSKAGIRFAIQLASQNKSSLVFYHCTELLKPASWSKEKYQSYVSKELESTQDTLFKFVSKVYHKIGITKPKFECTVQHGANVQWSIINYATEIKATAICMSTRGAGRFKKLIGTNASGILTTSLIPVFVIPKTYRRAPVRNILYASDLNNLRVELKQVRHFAMPLKAKISVYHYDYLLEVGEIKKKLGKVSAKFKSPDVLFNFKKLNMEQPFVQHLMKDVRRSKTSLTVLFTNQKRSWFDKLFLSSQSADVAFDSKVPLLVFSKNAR